MRYRSRDLTKGTPGKWQRNAKEDESGRSQATACRVGSISTDFHRAPVGYSPASDYLDEQFTELNSDGGIYCRSGSTAFSDERLDPPSPDDQMDINGLNLASRIRESFDAVVSLTNCARWQDTHIYSMEGEPGKCIHDDH